MRIGSLFTGYGGLDMAVQNVLGGEVAWYSEIDKHACQVLDVHHPDIPNLGDVTSVDWASVAPVDVLTGGYPCQPFSHAGQRKGTDDHRHLWPYVRDAIATIRPMVTILENVDGHRSLGLDIVLGDIASLGLAAEWVVVRAADAGAPHNRKRIFIVVTDPDKPGLQRRGAWASDAGRARTWGTAADNRGGVLADADSGRWSESIQQPGDKSAANRAGAATIPPGRGADISASDPDGEGWQGADSLRRNHAGGNGEGGFGLVQAIGAVAHPDYAGNAQRSQSGGSEHGSAESSSPVDWGKYGPAIHRWERVIGRPAPSPTIPGVNDRPRLSPMFVEWMMGLPEGHVTGHGLRPAACLKMLGNGVVPQQAELALRLLGLTP